MPTRARQASRAPKTPRAIEEALKCIIERLLDALAYEYLSDRLRPVWKDAKRAGGREG